MRRSTRPKEEQGANCAFLPVTAGAGSRRLVGMITDGDICTAARLRGRSLEELRVCDTLPRKSLSKSGVQRIARATADFHTLPADRPDTDDINWQLEDQAFKYPRGI